MRLTLNRLDHRRRQPWVVTAPRPQSLREAPGPDLSLARRSPGIGASSLRAPNRLPAGSLAAARPTRCSGRSNTSHRPGYVRNYASAELAIGEVWTKVIFGLLTACVVVMGLTCFWNLQALIAKWSLFVEAWRGVLS